MSSPIPGMSKSRGRGKQRVQESLRQERVLKLTLLNKEKKMILGVVSNRGTRLAILPVWREKGVEQLRFT